MIVEHKTKMPTNLYNYLKNSNVFIVNEHSVWKTYKLKIDEEQAKEIFYIPLKRHEDRPIAIRLVDYFSPLSLLQWHPSEMAVFV